MIFQVGASLLDACVLAVLAGGDVYGYMLTQSVKGMINVSESTLYPVLRRLQKDGLLTAYDLPVGGRNRRYYQATATGLERLQFFRAEWTEYKSRVDSILLGGAQQ